MPRSACPLPEALDKLISIIQQIRCPVLLKFTHQVFEDLSIAERFLSVPASFEHHDSLPGGLIHHTVKVTEKVLNDPLLMNAERDIALVAAIFHDIEKVHTHAFHKPWSIYLNHDLLTLEILANPLLLLQNLVPETADELRYIWTHKRMYTPRSAVYATACSVSRADRLSAKEAL